MNQPSSLPNASSHRRFLPAFGRAALALGAGSLGFSAVFGAVIRSLRASEPPTDAATISVVATVSLVFVLACAISGVVFGLLALAGFGKVDGKSHRVSGTLGMIAGGLMTVLAVSSVVAAVQLRERQSAPWPFADTSVGLTLQQPGPEWLLSVGEKARAIHRDAVGVAIEPTKGDADPRIVLVLVESLPGIDASRIDLQTLGETMAENSPMTEKRTELVELVELDGMPAVKHVVAGSNAGKRCRLFCVSAISRERCLHFQLIGDEADPLVSDSEFEAILRGLDLAELPEEPVEL